MNEDCDRCGKSTPCNETDTCGQCSSVFCEDCTGGECEVCGTPMCDGCDQCCDEEDE